MEGKRRSLWMLTCIYFLLNIINLSAQELSKSEIEAKAEQAFRQADYTTAVELYESLYTHFPKDNEYNYFLGRSYLHNNQELVKAISCLKFAASKNFNNDVHYYLAEAYLKTYDVEGAGISVNNFIKLAKKSELKKLNPENLKMAISAFTSEIDAVQPIAMIDSKEFKLDVIPKAYSLFSEGKLIRKPEDFMTKSDKEEEFYSLMFLPAQINSGDYLYVCSINDKGKKNKDIFQIKRLNEMDYRFPTLMGNGINTQYDEEFPFYDSKNQILYFSSKRPGGLGGYDLYKSEYSESLRAFKEPERLNFPINTPFDDILYMTSTAEQEILFSSNRSSIADNFTTYQLEKNLSAEFLFPKEKSELAELASFSVQTSVTNPAKSIGIEDEVITEVYDEYDIVLAKAMDIQLYCDSLRGELMKKKNLLRIEDDVTIRKVYIADIASMEKNLESKQSEANDLFLKAENLRPIEVVVMNEEKPESSTVTATEQNNEGITQYTYNKPDEVEQPIHQKELHNPDQVDSKSTVNSLIPFRIQAGSPYSDANPIPANVELPNGLVYRIQLGAFSQEVPMDAFGGLEPVTAEEIQERSLTKYYVGFFDSSKQAKDALAEVKNYGFQDAFIVPFYNSQKIGISKARELEYSEK